MSGSSGANLRSRTSGVRTGHSGLAFLLCQRNRKALLASGARVELCEEDERYRAGKNADSSIREKQRGNAAHRICLAVNEGDVGDGDVGSGSEESKCGGSQRVVRANGLENDSYLDRESDRLKEEFTEESQCECGGCVGQDDQAQGEQATEDAIGE